MDIDAFPKELTEKPVFSEELRDKCRKDKNFMPILFEWYKYILGVCNVLASMSRESLAIKKIPALHYAILTGLLNRCSRLMLSNIRLSATKKYGETVMLIGRSIYESAVIIQWLCYKDSEECFNRYLADGMKKDLILRDHIQESIEERGGELLNIESTMLLSIQQFIDSTNLTEEQIRHTKSLPDLWSICRDIGLSERFYIGFQRMGSHEVHGSWTSLKTHYLRQDEKGEYSLRDADVAPNENQFMVIPLLILYTLEKFIEYVVTNLDYREPIILIFKDAISEMENLAIEITKEDFELKSD